MKFLAPRETFQAAEIGIARRAGLEVVAYDAERVVDCLMKQNDWSREDALDWYEFNILNSYVGEDSPLFIEPGPIEDDEDE